MNTYTPRDAPPTEQLAVLEAKMEAPNADELTRQLQLAIRLGQPVGKLVVQVARLRKAVAQLARDRAQAKQQRKRLAKEARHPHLKRPPQ